ncbi:hypothetical protein BH09PAT1_BH09PAT1_2420 [soil metagenome]
MNICIVYDTYSSSTETVVGIVDIYLKEKNYTVTIKRMRDGAAIADLKNTDLTIFATPSWFERKQEGQPHSSFLHFIDSAQNESFSGMRYALIGLGDSTYARFCNGIVELGKFLEQHNGAQIGETLKLDSFFFDEKRQTERLAEWLEQLPL